MTNRLAGENSPYLLQHADNPVDWYPWGEEAFKKARLEDKPIFLSIGYAACHWCHVMAHESFEDPETAALMNQHFVNIKVDREERPDIDGIYMSAVVAMTGQGGWPMSVFLTPNGEPFYGGTYFPPVRRYNMPSFQELLLWISEIWQNDRKRFFENSQKMTAQLKDAKFPVQKTSISLLNESLEKAAMTLAQEYDWDSGGWGGAPKFPQPMTLEFLLRQAARGDKLALDISQHALRAMAKGGMYDVVGGGFSRYSVDEKWLIPHFEKMLYDNAQLASAYLHCYLLTGDLSFRRVCEETLDFVAREMTHSQGGFYSSLDADSEGEEGKYYLWTKDEVQDALDDPEKAALFIAAYGISEEGNFEGKTILQRALDDAALAEQFDLSSDEVYDRLSELHSLLLETRERRIRPGTDDKVLVSWNALMLIAFSEAGRYLGRSDYIEMAIRNADFLLTELRPRGRMLRSWRDGTARHNAYLEDYASLILGMLSLYQTDSNPRWYKAAFELGEEMVSLFQDPEGGFFDTGSDHEALLIRPKEIQDNATPSGNGLAATALLQLAAYSGKGEWRDRAETMLKAVQDLTVRYPTAFGQWLCALDFAIGPTHEIAILGNMNDSTFSALKDVVWSEYRPNYVVALSEFPPPESAPPLLEDRPLLKNKPTAYVCQHFVCKQPVTSPEKLTQQLEGKL